MNDILRVAGLSGRKEVIVMFLNINVGTKTKKRKVRHRENPVDIHFFLNVKTRSVTENDFFFSIWDRLARLSRIDHRTEQGNGIELKRCMTTLVRNAMRHFKHKIEHY